eukprot:79428-Rhodomonas_salina.2
MSLSQPALRSPRPTIDHDAEGRKRRPCPSPSRRQRVQLAGLQLVSLAHANANGDKQLVPKSRATRVGHATAASTIAFSPWSRTWFDPRRRLSGAGFWRCSTCAARHVTAASSRQFRPRCSWASAAPHSKLWTWTTRAWTLRTNASLVMPLRPRCRARSRNALVRTSHSNPVSPMLLRPRGAGP